MSSSCYRARRSPDATCPGLIGVPFSAESSMDDTMLTTPASEEAVMPADGVTGADSSLSQRG